jgi:uncharacterized protein (DUF849 family)
VAHLQAAPAGPLSNPAVPRTPDEIALEAVACVAAGATLFHLHAYDDDGRESLEPRHVAAVLRAVRRACPGVPLNMTTFAEIEPDPARRLALVAAWTELPDLVAANQGEHGIDELSETLVDRGVQVEACLLSLDDAQRFARSPRPDRFARVVVEPLVGDESAALALDEQMEAVVTAAGIGLEQLHHGVGPATWAILRRAAARGHGVRVGLEDVDTLPDGSPATSTAALVAAARELVADARTS